MFFQWFSTNLPGHERDLTIILGTNIFDHADVTKEPLAIINTSLFSSPLIIVKVQYKLKIIIILCDEYIIYACIHNILVTPLFVITRVHECMKEGSESPKH